MVLPSMMKLFASHDWGKEDASNHARVVQLITTLHDHYGFEIWLDEKDMKGNIIDAMTRGIDDCDCFLAFVTRNYMSKVASARSRDNCRREFMYAADRVGAERMIAIRFDDDLPSRWAGPVGMTLGSTLYVDLSPSSGIDLTRPSDALATLASMILAKRTKGVKAMTAAVKNAGAVRAITSPYAASPRKTTAAVITSPKPRPSAPATPRQRVARVSRALELDGLEHMNDVLVHALKTMGVTDMKSDAPFADRLARAEAELGLAE